MEDRYLGDGVYASFDGFGVVLDLRGQDNTTRICMEPSVIAAFNKFVLDAKEVPISDVALRDYHHDRETNQ